MVKMERFNTNENLLLIEEAEKILLIEKSKKSGSYNHPKVKEALTASFGCKCYLCERRETASYEIEHIRPHLDDKELKFNFNNMLLSCHHCNNTKSIKYKNILDCTKENIDELICFRKIGNYFWEEKIQISPNDTSRKDVLETISLLNAIYTGSTPDKKIECKDIIKELRTELNKFINLINEYTEASGINKEDLLFEFKKQLRCTSTFTAFKRWIVRDNKEYLPELYNLLNDYVN